eukprot:3427636-Amphidinium_carterae.1
MDWKIHNADTHASLPPVLGFHARFPIGHERCILLAHTQEEAARQDAAITRNVTTLCLQRRKEPWQPVPRWLQSQLLGVRSRSQSPQ